MIKPLITECIICGGDAEYVKEDQDVPTGYQDQTENREWEGWQCQNPICGHFEEIIPEYDGDDMDDDS